MSSDINSKITDEAEIGILSSNICSLMSRMGVDSSELSKKTGIALTTINGLKKGAGNPTLSTLNLLADFFGVTIGQLTEKNLAVLGSDTRTVYDVPLLNLEDLSEFLKKPNKYKRTISTELNSWKPNKCYAIKLNNNGMSPLFEKGTIFVVAQDTHIHDGDMVLVQFDNYPACFRRVYVEGRSYFFKAVSEVLGGNVIKEDSFVIHGIVIKAIQHFHDR